MTTHRNSRYAMTFITYRVAFRFLFFRDLYSMIIGYESEDNKLFSFMFFIISSFNYFHVIRHDVGGTNPICDARKQTDISSVMHLWNSFAGFLVAKPVGIWTINGVTASQLSHSKGPRFSEEVSGRESGNTQGFLGYIMLGHSAYLFALAILSRRSMATLVIVLQ